MQTAYEEATKRNEEDPSALNQNLLNDAKEVLRCFHDEKAKGIIIYARVCWHEHGERSTKYFLNLQNRNNVKNHIRKLLISGASRTDPFKTLEEQKQFYHNLYKSQYTDTDSKFGEIFLSNLNIPKLSEEVCAGDH